MRRVVIESPYGTRTDGSRASPTEVAVNVAYLRLCILDSLNRGEAPFASHGFYPQALNDATPEEREIGILAGLAWGESATLIAAYVDRGVTTGMVRAVTHYRALGIHVVERRLV